MKRVHILIIIVVQVLLYHACNQESKNAEKPTSVYESDLDTVAKNFIKLASERSIMEVEFAKVARQKASAPAVKEFAEMMMTDHTRIFNELKKLATDKYILLPIEMEQAHARQLNELQKLNGNAFDINYMRTMASEQQKAFRAYKAGANNSDKDINEFASGKIQLLKTHLNSARSIFNNVVIRR